MRRFIIVILLAGVVLTFLMVARHQIKNVAPSAGNHAGPPPAKKLSKSFSDVACADTYLKLFSKPVIDIRMIFGYKDARPARFVDDRYEEMIFIQRITGECAKGREDCGFQIARTGPSAGDVFTKSLDGPDGETKTIRLTVVQSSVSPDDEENRKNPFQKWQTHYAHEEFINALKSADVVFYNGHSRSGGGPDFAPPIVDGHGHVKYAWYKSRATSLTAMESAIRASEDSNLQMIGLFSCASEQLFTQKLNRAKPGVGLLSSQQLLYFSDALENSLLSLSALLEMKCRSDWSGLFETKTDLNGFWLNEAERTAKERIKGRGQTYSHRGQ